MDGIVMGYFYFDESIHDTAGFILGAYVYCQEDPDNAVKTALVECGFEPPDDEFKSSVRMEGNQNWQAVRNSLRGILTRSKLGLLVLPSSERARLGNEAIKCLAKIISANNLSETEHLVSFDQGIALMRDEDLSSQISAIGNCELRFDQISNEVGGLQLADLAAHTLSTMLLEQLGCISKMVKAGENSGYDPNMEIELGFEMWANIRCNLFTQDTIDIEADPIDGWTLDTRSYALFISNLCDETLRIAADDRFGTNYVGCIH